MPRPAWGRSLTRSFYAAYFDRVRAYQGTPAYEKCLRKRKVWVEPLFGEAKQWHGLGRFRLRSLAKVTTETLPCAAGQNLKRWLVATGWGRRYAACGAQTAPCRTRLPARCRPARGPIDPLSPQTTGSPHRRSTIQRGVCQRAVA
ncbi:MAG TPA: transposase [Chloroflexota bacterium]|nr:transposase [Chloroflexota bacterium]